MSITLGAFEYGISIQGHMHFLSYDFMQTAAVHSWMLSYSLLTYVVFSYICTHCVMYLLHQRALSALGN